MADKRGQAQAYAKAAGGIFLTMDEYKALLECKKRATELQNQVDDIANAQGVRESTSPMNSFFRKLSTFSPTFRRPAKRNALP